MTFSHKGHCSCGEVSIEFKSPLDLPDQSPRQCDCDYCATHGKPILLSDPAGKLTVTSSQALITDAQGSGQVDMLYCPGCGNALGARVNIDDQLIGVVNGRLLDETDRLPDPEIVSPKTLSPEEKRVRWLTIWTPAIFEVDG